MDRGEVTGGSWRYCGVYCGLSAAYIGLNLWACLAFIRLSARASARIHGGCLASLLAAPLAWFEGVPSGRVLARFSGDMQIMDTQFNYYSDGA